MLTLRHQNQLYFVETSSTLTTQELNQLKQLLDAEIIELSTLSFPQKRESSPSSMMGSRFRGNDGDKPVFVIPRFGTISPWSSKATEIAKICGLTKVLRIECGEQFNSLEAAHYDSLTQSLITDSADLEKIFSYEAPKAVKYYEDIVGAPLAGARSLDQVDKELGLALSDIEKNYLISEYKKLKRNPTDVELMMFAQINSEHCRHKIFNASWKIDGKTREKSLFSMIRNTHEKAPHAVLSAYSDNAAVMRGETSEVFFADQNKKYASKTEFIPYVLKVETHNHPTAISPWPGAATGSGGEIRDEVATGRGAKTKMGMSGFSVSHLHIPNYPQPWEICVGRPKHMASALEIMLQGPLGAAAFNNEYGRPNLCGYFRSFGMALPSPYGEVLRGYHKPIMIAGGLGQIRVNNVLKKEFAAGTLLIVLGGPAMAIGLGGGAASSRASQDTQQELDFASVQRANPEMQRRAFEVIQQCASLENNPILSIHDVGAGGLSNAMPELVEAVNCGALLQLRDIPNAEPSLSPLAIWCNEAQERFVLALNSEDLPLFRELCERERCPFAVLGEATENPKLIIEDQYFHNKPVDLELDILFKKMPRLEKSDNHAAPAQQRFDFTTINLAEAIERVLQFPAVADKSFLITISDRTVGGMTARDQMIGPWQIPVSDVAVSANNFTDYIGQALAVGERAPIALLHPAASARMSVGEAITNLAAANVAHLSDVVLSANWMAAADYPGEGAALYDAVQAIGEELCPALGIAIPVGKDSLSMQTQWRDGMQQKMVTSPMSVVITAAANLRDIRRTLTPQLHAENDSILLMIDLSEGANELGASVLLQVYNCLGERPADLDNPQILKNFFDAIQKLNEANLILAYHDRSDGGLLALICEMQFCSHLGVDLHLPVTNSDRELYAQLFSEELGAVIQVRASDIDVITDILQKFSLMHCVKKIGIVNNTDELRIFQKEKVLYQNSRVNLQKLWSRTSYELRKLRDNPVCAEQEFAEISHKSTGLRTEIKFELDDYIASPYINLNVKPKVAILREQGVNGHLEMAAAFTHAGFEAYDIHMTDILENRVKLENFNGLAACGGFSYGDVLGAGRGWAQSILMHEQTRREFENFFRRETSFALGICNGCQMMAQLKEIIPGAQLWPRFTKNQSQRFEARLVMSEVMPNNSLFFQDMQGSKLPVVVAHGEGFANFQSPQDLAAAQNLVALRYLSNEYPGNPNGSPQGITGLTNQNGRVLIMMPHPERVFLNHQLSYREFDEHYSPWFRLFVNARKGLE